VEGGLEAGGRPSARGAARSVIYSQVGRGAHGSHVGRRGGRACGEHARLRGRGRRRPLEKLTPGRHARSVHARCRGARRRPASAARRTCGPSTGPTGPSRTSRAPPTGTPTRLARPRCASPNPTPARSTPVSAAAAGSARLARGSRGLCRRGGGCGSACPSVRHPSTRSGQSCACSHPNGGYRARWGRRAPAVDDGRCDFVKIGFSGLLGK